MKQPVGAVEQGVGFFVCAIAAIAYAVVDAARRDTEQLASAHTVPLALEPRMNMLLAAVVCVVRMRMLIGPFVVKRLLR